MTVTCDACGENDGSLGLLLLNDGSGRGPISEWRRPGRACNGCREDHPELWKPLPLPGHVDCATCDTGIARYLVLVPCTTEDGLGAKELTPLCRRCMPTAESWPAWTIDGTPVRMGDL